VRGIGARENLSENSGRDLRSSKFAKSELRNRRKTILLINDTTAANLGLHFTLFCLWKILHVAMYILRSDEYNKGLSLYIHVWPQVVKNLVPILTSSFSTTIAFACWHKDSSPTAKAGNPVIVNNDASVTCLKWQDNHQSRLKLHDNFELEHFFF